jgi:Bacteriophage head to tail connecting protein
MQMDEYKRAARMATSLKMHRQQWDPDFRELGDLMLPTRNLFSDDPAHLEQSRQGKTGNLNRKMLDSTPRQALRILQSGMQSGLSNQARPWFKLKTQDLKLNQRPGVMEFFDVASRTARSILSTSGAYNALHVGYGDLGVYGTECALLDIDPSRPFRITQLVPGTYWLGASDHGQIDTCYREYSSTVNQVVGKFVYKGQRYGTPDWEAVAPYIRDMFDKGDIGQNVAIAHLITPRHEGLPGYAQNRKPVASVYWVCSTQGAEYHNKSGRLMGVRGYDRSPISASRWTVMGESVYGVGPGMDAAPDIRELNAKRRDYAEMMRRVNRPTMNAHTDLRRMGFSMLPGVVNFMADPSKGLVPAFQVNPQFQALGQDINETRERIWSAMYADLFMMISNLDRRQITAREIDERSEEKLLGLGPTVELQQFEKHGPLLENVFTYALETGQLPEMPQELQDQEIEIEYTSTLAQAQRAVETGGIERLWAFAGNMSAVKPEVLDKLDADQSIDEYADMIGVPSGVVLSDEKVAELRQARQAQLDQQQQLQTMATMAPAINQGAQAAKVLAEADGPRGPAPVDILQRIGAAPGI